MMKQFDIDKAIYEKYIVPTKHKKGYMLSLIHIYIGAGQFIRVKKGVKIGLFWGMSCTVIISTIVLVSRYYLFRMFNSEPEVIQCGIQVLLMTAPVYFIYVAIEVLSGTVQGAGASFIPMIISISNLCVLRVILLAIVVPLWNSVQAIACLLYTSIRTFS